MKKISKILVSILSIAVIFGITGHARSATLVDLNTASDFAVLAGAAISDTAVASNITGDVGLSPTGGTAITQLSCTDVNGVIYDNNGGYTGGYDSNISCLEMDAGLLTAAKADVSLAYNNIKGQAQDFSVIASQTDSFVGIGYTLAPGVYNSSSEMGVPANITLDGGGDSNAVFIFQAGSTLTTVSGSVISLINGARASNVFWQVGSSAKLGTSSTFEGTIMAAVSITDDGGSIINGRLLADADDTDADSTGAVTLNNTIVNAPTTLRVVKNVINDDGGIAVASDFIVHVEDGAGDVTGSPQPGEGNPGSVYNLSAGTYTVSEDVFIGYGAVFGGDCAADGTITLDWGDNMTCTIINDDIALVPATLRVVKNVINDDGGTAVASDFIINVTGINVSLSSFSGSEVGVEVTLDAGIYEVTEISLPGYLQSGSGDCSGVIAVGETKICTITNDDIAPQLIVNKIVVNDNNGTKVIADFSLFIDGNSVTSGVVSTTTVGLHTVSETTDSNYISDIGGSCAADGKITLELGDVKTCTITNDDIALSSGGGGGGGSPLAVPPLISVVKVPSPLALPEGPGAVKYTYTLHNIGTVPVTHLTMAGDTCSPITLISGDINNDARLDVDETWVYTCSTTLTKTHTNIVTASGWANGISATDIANATVIVGVPVVSPLIHVTKVPSPLALPAGGGMVTYTNKVTNLGVVALSNVILTDDKCDFVKYISGDTNNNSKLDITETWTYTCSANLTKTTVNTVIASGDANGLTARDFAIVTVVVNASVPKLPNTGLPPNDDNILRNSIALAGIFSALIFFYFARRKQRA